MGGAGEIECAFGQLIRECTNGGTGAGLGSTAFLQVEATEFGLPESCCPELGCECGLSFVELRRVTRTLRDRRLQGFFAASHRGEHGFT